MTATTDTITNSFIFVRMYINFSSNSLCLIIDSTTKSTGFVGRCLDRGIEPAKVAQGRWDVAEMVGPAQACTSCS